MSLRFVVLALALAAAACSEDEPAAPPAGSTPDAGSDVEAPPPGIAVAAEEQRAGDPAAGYTALVNEGYVGCGVPWSAYSQVFGAAPPELKLPGRLGKNADLPYQYTAFTTASGVEVVSLNCLVCHASFIKDELVVGLGAAQGDFTTDPSGTATAAGFFVSAPADKVEYEKWKSRVQAIGPHTTTLTIGANPGDNVGAVLFAHRDRETLAWSDEPLMDLPPDVVVPVDVPPWWRMAKKNAMFYVGAGRGDHARIMMTASTLCTDTVPEAQAIDAYFPDVRAYIASIEPPVWPFELNAGLADQGKVVFETTCARCHGTYGAEESYPNLLIPIEEVGTDGTLALGGAQFAGAFVEWFNESFYGEIARLEPTAAYYAPPLDGIWATAPYLHNGSVPTLAALLDSTTRPQFWTRSYDPNDYDTAAVGWIHTPLAAGHDAEPSASARKKIIDTTKLGYGNAGHTYGDALSVADRAALLEYLKTL
jgi:hypothetical protein